MKLIWTRADSLLSKTIRTITGENCSHFAFVFETKAKNGIMFESNLLGTHPAFYQTSLKTHQVVHSINIQMSDDEENKIWDQLVDKYDGRPYDFGGALYLGWRKVLLRLFRLPIPDVNRWGSGNADYCEEVYAILSENSNLPKINTSMSTPHDLWLVLENWKSP